MEMKKSKYNYFFKLDEYDDIVAFNTRTCSLATIEKSNYKKYTNDYESIDENFKNDLAKGGFLVESSIDERNIINNYLLSNRYNKSSMGITIAPTLDCDFACIYCYEKGQRKDIYMDKDIQDALIRYIEYQFKSGVKSIGISWYGGEPLLAIDIIVNLTNRILNLCEEYDVNFGAGIITNGYNLTPENMNKLINCKVTSIQVTIDGSQEIHDSRRPLVGGGGTFTEIISNIETLHKEGYSIPISLRVNIDKTNRKSIYDVLDILENKNLQKYVTPYPGYVEPTNDAYSVNACLSYEKYSKLDFEIALDLIKRGFLPNLQIKYPFPRANYCGADSENAIVIGPKGNIYKCWSDIGRNEYKIGNILEHGKFNMDKYYEYMGYNPVEDEECSDCKLLPICMGGCPRKRMDNIVDRCDTTKYVLEEFIESIANNLIKNNNIKL